MDVRRHGQIEERIATGAAGALYGEDILGQRLVTGRVQLLSGGIVSREDALQARGAEFARLHFDEEFLAGFHLHAVSIDFAVLFEPAVDHARDWHRAFHGLQQFGQVADRENEGQRGRVGQCHAGEGLGRVGFSQIDGGVRAGARVRSEEGDLSLSAPRTSQRKDAVGIAVRAHFEPVEILCLRTEARVGDFDVIAAVGGKGEIETCIEAGSGAVVTARQLLARAIQYAQYRVDGRAAAPRLHFEDAPLVRFAGYAVDIALGTAQGPVDHHGRGSHGLGGLDGIVAIGRRIGLRFFLRHLGIRSQREQQDIGHARRRLNADGVDAGRHIGAGFHQEGDGAAGGRHDAGLRRGHNEGEGSGQRAGDVRAFPEVPAHRGQCEGTADLRAARLQLGEHGRGSKREVRSE